jgi:pyruvate formate lyase activating enzyme
MADASSTKSVPLEAASPFEMRTDLGKDMPEPDVRAALHSGDIGFLHSFTTGSCVDGPGVRLVAWTTSCMFRCQYCHNPDTWTLSNGIPITIAHATDELQKYATGLDTMGGGLTISGGEPLMQHRFVSRLFAEARKLDIHTCLQTNGFYGTKFSNEDLENVDLVIVDMKALSSAQHHRVTGVENNNPVIEFCVRLAVLKKPMWLRYVVVPGLTVVEDEMKQMAHFAAALGVIEKVEILPFHQMGRYKWERLGIPYQLEDTEPPSQETVDRVVNIFRAAGLRAE